MALHCKKHNTFAHSAQSSSIVEDLAQAPSTMSTLEVLKNYPAQRKSVLLAIGAVDPQDSMLSIFDMEKFKPPHSHQFAFQVQFFSKGRGVHKTIIGKGSSTYFMSTSCSLALLPQPSLHHRIPFNLLTVAHISQKGTLLTTP